MYMKKFDARVRPSTRVLTSHWGWRIVEEVDETRYWVKLVGMVGRLRYSEVFKQEPMTGMFCYQKIAGNRARLS